MQLNEQYKHSKITLLVPLQLPTANFHCNCGIALPHRSRLCSICSALCKSIQSKWLMRYSMVHTIGTIFPLHPRAARPSFTNPQKHGRRGAAKVPTQGTLDRLWTITAAIIILCQRHKHIKFLGPPNYSPNIAKFFFMWNKHLQEVIDKLVITLQELPPDKRVHVLTKVCEHIMDQPSTPHIRTITSPITSGCFTQVTSNNNRMSHHQTQWWNKGGPTRTH